MAHGAGLHTALDTSGFLGVRATDALLRDADLVLLDIKSWDRETYRKVTGRPLRPTLDFAQRLADLGKEVHLRFVLVPGLTDARENIEGVAAFAGSLGNVSRVDVLPFHKLGEAKWQALDMNFTLHDTPVADGGADGRGEGDFRGAGTDGGLTPVDLVRPNDRYDITG
ncbi:hypothetical protein [Streptomyces sp. NPDC041003]|uniref:radical SAM protein n=1 Tax=Streptomyces sp. NPDC041003 TaxID=3155730 RepID=UPI003405234E